ncbi:GNAT family N-acetyltransferase [Streptomyces pseudovenezuelae]|uniref:GNAT family N-acetyltransferase n=1 Tax=Streptomyces pseudovenezuelae TaxID=67350 RepID=A0ABZ1WUU0_9ACTN|nr:N-acetyltransferase [Streptomyces pseudovenezuelae]
MIPISGEKRMRIRAVEEKDLPELARIDAEAFPSAPYPYFVLRQYFDICGDHLFVVEDDEPRLYGYVLASPPHHTLSWIISLGVTPELRRNGLGRRLMVAMLHRLQSEGAQQILLTVEPDNGSAILLYRSLGFVAYGTPDPDYFGRGEPRLLMTLSLRTAPPARGTPPSAPSASPSAGRRGGP